MMDRPELYDQEGYIIRLGVGGYLRWQGLVIHARDCSIWVNDERWNRCLYVEAKAEMEEITELGHHPGSYLSVPAGAHGLIRVFQYEAQEMAETVARLKGLHSDSHVAIALEHPDTGAEIRRVQLRGCRWDPPTIDIERRDGRRRDRQILTVEFKAEYYTDDAVASVP